MATSPPRSALIELRLWRQFLAVADTLHFGRAAQQLHMTQPPLTQAIAQLEALLDVKLFDRTKRSVQLTVAGAALVPEARDLLARALALPRLARANANGDAGRLRLGFVSTAGFDVLPRWVRAFREHHPGVQLELIEATGDVQQSALERGDIDAGFMLHAPGVLPPGLQRLLIASEALVVALPEQHPLARVPRLTLTLVLAEPLVIFPHRIVPSLHDAIMALYHAAGCTPQVAQEAIQMQTIVNLVSAGLGLAWVPESVRQFQRDGVVYRAVADDKRHPIPTCETSLVWTTPHVATLDRFLAFAPAASAP
jgi:DNA-binding transcriptional LysR family regulator